MKHIFLDWKGYIIYPRGQGSKPGWAVHKPIAFKVETSDMRCTGNFHEKTLLYEEAYDKTGPEFSEK